MHNYVKAKRVPNNTVLTLKGKTTAALDVTSASPSSHTCTPQPRTYTVTHSHHSIPRTHVPCRACRVLPYCVTLVLGLGQILFCFYLLNVFDG